jgi:MFS family permease
VLGSITPLGERARGRRWGVTVAAYTTGSALGGVAVGSVLGALGSVIASPLGVPLRVLVIGVAAALGVIADARVAGLRPPSVSRQVNEEWMTRYRGWVYGVGFGVQLGIGVVTVVTTSALYVALLAALLTGTIGGGALVGGAFGLVRGATILSAAGVRGTEQLGRVHATLGRWEGRSRIGTVAAQGAVAVVIAVGAVR